MFVEQINQERHMFTALRHQIYHFDYIPVPIPQSCMCAF